MTQFPPAGPPQDPHYGGTPQPGGIPPNPQFGGPQNSQFGQQPTPQFGAMPPASGYGQGSGPGMPTSMGKRLVAKIIDALSIGIPLGIVASILFPAPEVGASLSETLQSSVGRNALGTVVFAAYEICMIALRGATIGKSVMKIKVTTAAGGIPGWGPAALRYLIVLAGFFVCGIGALVVYLSPLFDSSGRRQGWHDKVAKTYVVDA
ncbi:MAG: RDD family protein [Angustibacter sp.]